MNAAACLLCLALAGPAAAGCPPAPDRSDEMAALTAEVRAATTEMAARAIGNRMWEIWAEAPDAAAQQMLDRGMRARASLDFDGAVAAFDDLTSYCPDYAEGYNQRAFVRFMRQGYGAALVDLDRAVELSPTHVAALAGKALTLMGLGRTLAAQGVLREALALNPWLPERRFVIEPPGEDL